MDRATVRRLAVWAPLLLLLALTAGCGSSGQSSGATSPAAAGTEAAFTAGDTVAATWTDGNLYLATVKSVGGGTVNVVYSDDGSAGAVPVADVRAIPNATFAPGDRVLAVWSKGRFYAGRVTKADGSSYVIAWDDGSTPSTVEAGSIIAQ